MKVGRNQPCPCGSGQKFKKCHGRLAPAPGQSLPTPPPGLLEKFKAEQLIREQQQGLGRPIVAAKLNDHQVVAVRNRIMWSDKWKTFPDFLADYIKTALDISWCAAEMAKPPEQRHTILHWAEWCGRYAKSTITEPGKPTSAPITGAVAAYLGLSYSLYLLDHNVDLQKRLVQRLKDPGQFQGAYYELIVANILLRSGFELALIDEADRKSRHCEFSAVSKATGKKYWVEAKMRAVAGVLGRTTKDGSTDTNPISKLATHVSDALGKPADDDRLIFVDVNTAMSPGIGPGNEPPFLKSAIDRLRRYEATQLTVGQSAYVFVTNFPFHLALDDHARMVGTVYGLGIPDFLKAGNYRLKDIYLQELKHADALRIGDTIGAYLQFPETFDGSLPSEAFGESSRVQIGETYFFGKPGEGGKLGTVTYGSVVEAEKSMYIAITTETGAEIHRQSMTEVELADYRRHPEAYFGRILPVSKPANTPKELFDFFIKGHKQLTRDQILERLAAWPNQFELATMSQDELLAEYCEALTRSMANRTGHAAA